MLVAPPDYNSSTFGLYEFEDDRIEHIYRFDPDGEVRWAQFATAGSRFIFGGNMPWGSYRIADRNLKTVVDNLDDLEDIRDIAVFSNNYALFVGSDWEGRGRPDGYVPGALLRPLDGTPLQMSLEPRVEPRFYTPLRFGFFRHVALSPMRDRALLLGLTYDKGDETVGSVELLVVVMSQNGKITYERSLPIATSWVGGSLTGSAYWTSEDEVVVHLLSRDEALKRLVINAINGRSRLLSMGEERRAAAPEPGCAPLFGAQSGFGDMLVVSACGEEDAIVVAYTWWRD